MPRDNWEFGDIVERRKGRGTGFQRWVVIKPRYDTGNGLPMFLGTQIEGPSIGYTGPANRKQFRNLSRG